MSIKMILLSVFVEIVLTFALYWRMAYQRVTLIRSRVVHPRDVALRQPNWPTHALQVTNAALNQLELPVLFYVLTGFAIMTRKADVLFVALAWIFVLSRLAHAYVHVTHNRVSIRGPVFGIGLLVLTIMWLIFMVEVLASLP